MSVTTDDFDKLYAEIDRLKEENGRLREALTPFKNQADLNRNTAPYHRVGILMSDLINARAALSPKDIEK